MKYSELKKKYGDEMVFAIPADKVETKGDGPFFPGPSIEFCTKRDGIALYRYDAEGNHSYRQLVVYAMIRDIENGDIFVTYRLRGDSRLTGRYSIGTGGHMQPDETFTAALFRELEEEVGVSSDELAGVLREGYILDTSSDVNADHLGVVYTVFVSDRNAVSVRESEKLEGRWMTHDEIAGLSRNGKLESWSDIVFANCT